MSCYQLLVCERLTYYRETREEVSRYRRIAAICKRFFLVTENRKFLYRFLNFDGFLAKSVSDGNRGD